MSDKCSLRNIPEEKKEKESIRPPLLADELYALKKKRGTKEMDFLKDYVR